MKEASECLKNAQHCETLAEAACYGSSTRVLQRVAEQWRQLARDADRHKRLTWMRRSEASPDDA